VLDAGAHLGREGGAALSHLAFEQGGHLADLLDLGAERFVLSKLGLEAGLLLAGHLPQRVGGGPTFAAFLDHRALRSWASASFSARRLFSVLRAVCRMKPTFVSESPVTPAISL